MKFYQLSLCCFACFSTLYSLLTVVASIQSNTTHMYFTLEPFRVLNAPVLETIGVLDSFECLLVCMRTKWCVSVNFAVRSASDERFLCQLLTNDKKDKGRRQQTWHSSSYHHFYKNPCADNPCNNSGTCDVTDNKDFNCTCPPPYSGRLCEQVSWIKVNKDPMCYGAKNDTFGRFYMPSPGRVESIKLVHLRGTVTCDKDNPLRSTYWGCYSPDKNISKITTIITDNNRKKLLPTYSNNLRGFHGNSSAIVFSTESLPVFDKITAGQEFRIWYYEDFADFGQDDNDGLSCADVYILYKP